MAVGQPPTTEDKDWEQACGGSNIQVTRVSGKIVLIDALAEHFAEGRQWVCHYKNGQIVSAMYRHYIVSRKAAGDAGQFTTELKDDKVEVFHFPNHEIKGLDPALDKDLKEVISIATSKVEPNSGANRRGRAVPKSDTKPASAPP